MGDMYVDGGYRNKQLVDNTAVAAAAATAAVAAIVVVLSIVQFVSQIIYR